MKRLSCHRFLLTAFFALHLLCCKNTETSGVSIAEQLNQPVSIIDTSIVIDKTTLEETLIVNRFTMTLEEYIIDELGLSDARAVFNGGVHIIKDQYQSRLLYIQWNPQTLKIDTIKITPTN